MTKPAVCLMSPFEIDNFVREDSVKPIPQNLPVTLDLMVPWDLPLECHLDELQKQQIQESFRKLLRVLQSPHYDQASTQIAQILADLDVPNTQVAELETTRTSLSTAEVDDYDQYFGVHHVQTQETGLCLVRGLLATCHRFMVLCHQNAHLSPTHIAQQKQGFISYIYLLARVFNLKHLP